MLPENTVVAGPVLNKWFGVRWWRFVLVDSHRICARFGLWSIWSIIRLNFNIDGCRKFRSFVKMVELMDNPIGIVGYGIVGQALEYGFKKEPIFIYDKFKDFLSLKEVIWNWFNPF